MRQFDVCEVHGGPLVVVLQHNAMSDLQTRLVAPLLAAVRAAGVDGIHVPVQIDDLRYVVVVDQVSAVRRSQLSGAKASLRSYEYKLKNAIDRLFTGF
jgi:hypothetical protein